MSEGKRRICKCMKKSNETDQQIIDRVVHNGRRADYALLVDRYGARIFAFVATMVTRREDVEDLAQDCFVKAFRQLAQYDAKRSSGSNRIHNRCNRTNRSCRSQASG